VKANRVTMKLTTQAIVISMASMVSIAQAQRSSPRPTDVGATTAQPDTGFEKEFADPVDAYINSSMKRQHILDLSLVVIRDGKIRSSPESLRARWHSCEIHAELGINLIMPRSGLCRLGFAG
jgi:hypothetical protein